MGLITFDDKSTFEEKPSIPATKKGRAVDWNELKTVINENFGAFEAFQELVSSRGSIPLFDEYSDVATSGLGEDDLYSYTLPADFLTTDGGKIKLRYSGYVDSSGTANYRHKFYFDGQEIYSSGYLGSAPYNWLFDLEVVRVSNTVVRINGFFYSPSLVEPINSGDITGVDFTAPTIIKITGESDDAGKTVVAQQASGIYFPSAT